MPCRCSQGALSGDDGHSPHGGYAKFLDGGYGFLPTIATYIRERIWHPSQQITEQPDGSVELEFETAGWKELVRWILSWQPDVEVLEPLRLRERIREKLITFKFSDLEKDVSEV